MATKRTREELRAFFEKGDRPSQAEFADFIESCLNILDDGPKSYKALISQSGTDAPTLVVPKNTIGDIVWTRLSVGFFVGTLAGAFITGKTLLSIQKDNRTITGSGQGFGNDKIIVNGGDQNTIYVFTYDANGDLVDGILSNLSIGIEVYP